MDFDLPGGDEVLQVEDELKIVELEEQQILEPTAALDQDELEITDLEPAIALEEKKAVPGLYILIPPLSKIIFSTCPK